MYIFFKGGLVAIFLRTDRKIVFDYISMYHWFSVSFLFFQLLQKIHDTYMYSYSTFINHYCFGFFYLIDDSKCSQETQDTRGAAPYLIKGAGSVVSIVRMKDVRPGTYAETG